jgi:hypothetical protein
MPKLHVNDERKRVVRLFKNIVKSEYIMLGSRLRQRRRRKIE